MVQKTLIFVYNADAGRWNGYMDILHKIISPKTYPCKLCDLTHGVFKIRPEWAEFLRGQRLPLRFLHRDEWLAEFGREEALPAIFIQEAGELRLGLSAQAMQAMDLAALQAWVEQQNEEQP
jgi:hypothetical protein